MISAAAVRDFQFTRVPQAFLDDPYPWYAALRAQDPLHAPLSLPGGETRAFIADGDEVIQRGRCEREGAASIGFGEAAGVVKPAA